MSIKIEVTGESLTEVADKLLALGHKLAGDPTMPEVKVAAKKGKKEPVAAEGEPSGTGATEATTAFSSAEQQTEQSSEASTAATPTTDTKPLDFDKDVAPVVISFVQSKGKPYVVGILEQFGVAKASELPEDRWGELLAALAG